MLRSKISFFIFIIIILFSGKLTANKSSLHSEIDSLLSLSWELKDSESIIALNHAKDALEKSQIIDDDYYIGKSLFYLGTCKNRLGKTQAAIDNFYLAIEKLTEFNDDLLNARIYNGLGLALSDEGRYYDAMSYYDKALIIYEDINDLEGIALQIQNKGVIYYIVGRAEEALRHYKKSIKILNDVDDVLPGIIANNHINTAIVYMSIGQTDKALEYFTGAEQIYIETNDLAGLAHLYLNMGVMYFSFDLESSLHYHTLAKNNYKKLNVETKYAQSLGYVADIFRLKKEYEQAEIYYNKALGILDNQDFVFGKITALSGLGILYRDIGRYNESVDLLKQALEYSQKIDALELQVITSNELSQAYFEIKDYENAFNYSSKHKILNDSLINIEKIKEIKNIQYAFEFDEKQREIEALKLEQRTTNLKFVFFVIILSILLLSLSIVVNKQRIIRKKEKLRAKMFEELSDEKIKSYESELMFRKKILLNYALRITEKNNLLSDISNQLKKLKSPTKSELQRIIQNIRINLILHGEREEINQLIEKVGEEFFKKIDSISPDLTKTEKKVCVFLSLGFSSKDISGIMNISARTIDNYRSSIRKKMSIADDVNLNNYFNDL